MGYVGSISHAGGLIAAAVAQECDMASIGIDVEIVRANDYAEVIESNCLNNRERALLRSDSSLTRSELCTLFFSAKEAYFKCISQQVEGSLGFLDVEIVDYSEQGDIVIALSPRVRSCGDLETTLVGGFRVSGDTVFSAFELPTTVVNGQRSIGVMDPAILGCSSVSAKRGF